ncbi:DUF551 domain-containing protein [Salmonella enterica subsp. enterica]|uniref:DUF551 domain-containing protein n=1 Tax=Salmonella enterica subsp. enterica serovar Napoli TaxID=1151001 RepID=A0A5I0KXX9_SALET|nr:DUF551 domain-containing protein [Salmonella enterica subsp. enterica serovar Napoli]EAC0524638.1 DUF551 domain-containing protein [Salmonella enterica subsp. enterica serovar Zaiman]EAU6664257.1 DUF551 domain-containing protein [Salmonella enterica]ECF7025615.1 DUF551 domain-containing protein [Salmonella enterica subsp. enterica]ECY8076653.1 DUF551 domain-containing protein [Salmonella enterica subsp. enterica serovar Vitkin]EDW4663523.1 DUF551 domain-containing protein [Salmonella enteri
MTTITKEWLQQTIAEFENTRDDIPFGLSDDDAKVLIVLKRALVSLDAEPVRYLNKFSGTCVTLEQQSNAADDVAVYMPLYAAPPVPVQVDIEILASALKNAPLAPSDNQGRPRAPVVPAAIEPDYKVIKSILPTANPDEYACCIAADMWNACRAAMLQAGNHTEQHLDMVDHSGDANEKGSDGTFIDEGTKQACNSPVILEGWISCSERMPEQDDWVLIYSKHGEYLAGQVQGEYVELNDGTLSWLGAALHWMPLPEPPKQE